MITNTIQILSVLIILSIISCQDLTGGLANTTSSLLPSGIPSAINSNFNAIMDSFKSGAISEFLPKELDLSKVSEIDNILKDLNSTNFEFDGQGMIPDMKNLTESSPCIKKLANVFSFMSMAEQLAFYGAYQTTLSNKTTENQGRCFAPKTLHQTFKKINVGNIQAMNKRMTQDSKNIRNSFSCVGDTFRKLKIAADYKENIEGFINSQRTSNQCKGTFMRNLSQILGARRRYLLLNTQDSNSTAIVDSEGKIIGYSWLETEVADITKAFLTFADCYQALPEAITKTYADVLNKISADPICSQADAKRLLQIPTISDIKAQASGVIGVIGDLKNATAIDALKDATGGSIDALKNATGSTIIQTLVSGSAMDAFKNATGSAMDAFKNATGSAMDALKNATGSAMDAIKKAIKAKSIGNINFDDEQKKQLNIIADNLKKKGGDYDRAGQILAGVTQETALQSKCNMLHSISGLFTKQNEMINKLLFSEKQKQKEKCTDDYIVYMNKPKGGSSGNLYCTGADTLCQNTSLEFKNSYTDFSMTAVSACISSKRITFGYTESDKFGKTFDFNSDDIATCEKGQSNKCAKEFSKMKTAKSKRILQAADNKCIPSMKADCSDMVAQNCAASNLLETIQGNEPSSTDNSLPKECQNFDPVNPNYVQCFTWINKHLIAFTIFPILKKIDNLQALINESQAMRLRYLQENQIKIVATDASSTDTVAQLPASEVAISSDEVEIDGTTPDKIATADVVAEIDNSSSANSNSSSFNKFGYALIFLIIVIFMN